MMHIDIPYHFNQSGQTAETSSYADYVKRLVVVTLMTSPGERVNHPEFGAGLLEMVFEPNSETLAGATDFLIRAALQRWLQDILVIDDLRVANDDSQVTIDLIYTLLPTREQVQQTITRRL